MSVIDIIRNMGGRKQRVEAQREEDNAKAINSKAQQEKISREQNSNYYNDYLKNLVSSFFLHQAVCASQATRSPVRISLLQNALNTNGNFSPIIDPIQTGIYNFQDFCNSVAKTEKINTSSDVVLKAMMHSRNLFDERSNVEIDKNDIASISAVHEALLATYGGSKIDLRYAEDLTAIKLQQSFGSYGQNPTNAFNSDVFVYPDGHESLNGKEVVSEMEKQNPKTITRALYFITAGATMFQDQVASNSEDLNSNLEINIQ